MATDQKIPTNANIGGGQNHIVIEYQGFTQTKDQNNLNTQVTYQSTKSGIEHAMSAISQWTIGTVDKDWGRLDSINSQPGDGPFWKAVLNYNQPLSAGIIITTGNDDKPTQNSLLVRMMSMPIQSHPNYKYCWNHSLATCYGSNQVDFADISGLNAQEAQNWLSTHTDETGFCWARWIQNDSELPSQPIMVKDGEEQYAHYWKVEWYMTKAGVNSYDYPTYEIQQNARHTTRQNAAWSLTVKNGKIKFPQYGDFGIQNYFFSTADGVSATVSGHWLCEGGGVNYDGKYYVANCTYLWSPEPTGWDQQLYEVASGGYYNGSNHNPNSIFDGHMNTGGNISNPINGGN